MDDLDDSEAKLVCAFVGAWEYGITFVSHFVSHLVQIDEVRDKVRDKVSNLSAIS